MDVSSTNMMLPRILTDALPSRYVFSANIMLTHV